jgi:RNA polymerase sigma-70 factor (ECF subfamily)
MRVMEAASRRVEDVDDAGLARRVIAAGGDREAEEELCRRLGRRIRLYGLRHFRDEQAAADLVQDVLLIALQGLREGRVREPERLASYVLGTCRMVVLEIRRGGARRERLLEEYGRGVPKAVPPREPEPELGRLAACLDGLPPRERSVILMTFYDASSGDETARGLGVTVGNARVIRHRALARLRACLEAV